jgi:hypothetical protein
MPGFKRRDGTPPLAHSCPTGCARRRPRQPAAGHGRGAIGMRVSARAASLVSFAALPIPPRCHGGQASTHTLVPALVPRRATGVPRSSGRRKDHRWSCPPRGSGAAAPGGALRAIDSSARPCSWWTFGPHHLRRQSEPALVTTHGGADLGRLLTGQPGSRSCRSAKAAGSNQGRREAILPKAPEGQWRAAAAVCAVAVPGQAGWLGQEVRGLLSARSRRAPQTARFCWS